MITLQSHIRLCYPLKDGIKSLCTTLPDRIFLLGILLLEPCILLIYAWKTNKYTNYSVSRWNIVDERVVSSDMVRMHTTSLDTTRPSTIFYRLLLNSASLRRH